MIRLVVLLALLGGCSGGTYECGTTLEDSTEVHQCDRLNEVCVCGTRSCAFRLLDTEACPSGYRYSDNPYVSDDEYAKKCVPAALTEHLITDTTTVKSCAPLPELDAGADPTVDAAGDGPNGDAS